MVGTAQCNIGQFSRFMSLGAVEGMMGKHIVYIVIYSAFDSCLLPRECD